MAPALIATHKIVRGKIVLSALFECVTNSVCHCSLELPNVCAKDNDVPPCPVMPWPGSKNEKLLHVTTLIP